MIWMHSTSDGAVASVAELACVEYTDNKALVLSHADLDSDQMGDALTELSRPGQTVTISDLPISPLHNHLLVR